MEGTRTVFFTLVSDHYLGHLVRDHELQPRKGSSYAQLKELGATLVNVLLYCNFGAQVFMPFEWLADSLDA